MKRIVMYVVLAAAIFAATLGKADVCLAKKKTEAPGKNDLYARSAVLMDADSGRVLFEKDGQEKLPMASTTKILTCIVALESQKTEDELEVSAYAASMPDVQLHIRKGEHYKVKDLLYSLMLESHNDSAVAIAEHVGGSVEGFADLMNKKAAQIGCKNSYFITPNGLDAQQEVVKEDGSKEVAMHSTTAKDLALIMSYCIKKSPLSKEFIEITRTKSYSFSNVEGTRKFSCNNHNAFLDMMDGALSGKTGFTGKAGYCYVGALERDKKTYVVALLACGWPNNKTYKWSDTKKLMEYGINNFEKKDFSEEQLQQEWLADIPVADAQSEKLYGEVSAGVYVKEDSQAPVLLMKQDETAEVSCEVKKNLDAPVKKDEQVGTIRYTVDGEVLWERKICVREDVLKIDYVWIFKMLALSFFA